MELKIPKDIFLNLTKMVLFFELLIVKTYTEAKKTNSDKFIPTEDIVWDSSINFNELMLAIQSLKRYRAHTIDCIPFAKLLRIPAHRRKWPLFFDMYCV